MDMIKWAVSPYTSSMDDIHMFGESTNAFHGRPDWYMSHQFLWIRLMLCAGRWSSSTY